jgi:hypothetical protein
VAALGFGEGEQDLALLALAALGEVAVDLGLGALVGEVARPAAAVGEVGWGRGHGIHASRGGGGGRPPRLPAFRTSEPRVRDSVMSRARHGASRVCAPPKTGRSTGAVRRIHGRVGLDLPVHVSGPGADAGRRATRAPTRSPVLSARAAAAHLEIGEVDTSR